MSVLYTHDHTRLTFHSSTSTVRKSRSSVQPANVKLRAAAAVPQCHRKLGKWAWPFATFTALLARSILRSHCWRMPFLGFRACRASIKPMRVYHRMSFLKSWTSYNPELEPMTALTS
jgi:hypothetical protein